MKSICFLAANLQLKEKIEQVLTIATSQEQQTAIPFHVEVLNFPQRIEQAQKAIAQGADVIITNTGAHHDLSQVLKDVPILCLHYSTNDLLYVLSKLRYYEKIHVMLNQNIIINAAMCPAELIPKIEFHRYHTDISTEKLASIVNSIPASPHTAIVSCMLLPQFTHTSLPMFPIMPGESAILSAYQYARDIILSTEREKNHLSLLSSILANVDEGIIIYNAAGHITHYNQKAYQFLNFSYNPGTIQKMFPDLEEAHLTPPFFKDRILHCAPYTLVASSRPFRLNDTCFYILNIRDVTELQRLESSVRYKLSKTKLRAAHTFKDILTQDPIIKEKIEMAKKMAAYNAPVLIQGESGTGKELFAQSIHNASPRRSGPFVAVNCAALPPDLLESELFGYVGGAFTGARKEGKAGLFEMAHNGTIFLDEINSMPAEIQSKLLRVLEMKEVMRIGSDYVIPLDIRIISSSNGNIETMIKNGEFRHDLYFRLNPFILTMPSLNERPADIFYLFSTFLMQITGHTVPVPPQLRPILEGHHWWGNIRELYNAALRYQLYGEQTDPLYSYLFDHSTTQELSRPLTADQVKLNLEDMQHAMEKSLISYLLQQGCTKTQAASILGMSRQGLFKKMKKWD